MPDYKRKKNKRNNGGGGLPNSQSSTGGGWRSRGGGGPSNSGRNSENAASSQWQRERRSHMEDFIKVLQGRYGQARDHTEKMQRMINDFPVKWLAAWEFGPTLNFQQMALLLTVLARIPYSSTVGPPPIDHFQKTVMTFIQSCKNDRRIDHALKHLDLILNVIDRLLKFEWKMEKRIVREMMETVLCEAAGLLNLRNPEHRSVNKKVTEKLEELEKPWAILISDVDEEKIDTAAAEEEEGKSTGMTTSSWKKATVEWLSDPNTFSSCCLPAMKIPSDSSGGIYDSTEDYFRTMISLWIGMTFGEGHNAISPCCKNRGGASGDKMCGRVLSPITNSSAVGFSLSCHDCDLPATVACPNKYHGNSALCSNCDADARRKLRSGSESQSSTHVYDGIVKKMDFDGVLQLNDVVTRNKPPRAIHWRSTKRLSCPNLVGVVKLESRKASLQLKDRIYWGQVTQHRQGSGTWVHESEFREQGKVAISILGPADATEDYESQIQFQPNDTVAIIDCFTFFPEYIPVLKAMENQRLTGSVPFSNGAMLNMSTEGRESPLPVVLKADDSCFVTATNAELLCKVTEMVDSSELEPIIQLRRDESNRKSLIDELGKLLISATLDTGQLHSFFSSLQAPVHCTQGPPGSGKSYIGVIIARALLIIRKLWIAACPSAGSPPILVLSYKNHAIDEFLVDLLNSNPSRLNLIRLGGKSENPQLRYYSERSVVSSHPNVIHRQREAEVAYKQILELNSLRKEHESIFLSNNTILENKMDPKEAKRKRKMDYDAAVAFNKVLGRILYLLGRFAEATGADSTDNDALISKLIQILNETPNEKVSFESKVSFKDIFRKRGLPVVNLAELRDGFAHYQAQRKMPVEEILWSWMQGFVPVPQCRFSEANYYDESSKQCTLIAESHSVAVCVRHRCLWTSSDSKVRCPNSIRRSTDSYCAEHVCAFDSVYCKNARLPYPQTYCSDHACFKCLEHQLIANAIEDESSSNTCADHPLCNAFSRNGICQELAMEKSMYCTNHSFSTCKGFSIKGFPCESTAIPSRDFPYCREHRDQAPLNRMHMNPSSQTSHQMPCTAITKKKKKPCKGIAIPGMVYCQNHLDLYGQVIDTQYDSSQQVQPELFQAREAPAIIVTENAEHLPFAELIDDDIVKLDSLNEVQESDNHPSEALVQVGQQLLTESNDKSQNASNMNNISDLSSGGSNSSDSSDSENNSAETDSNNESEEEESQNVQHLREVYNMDIDEEFYDTFDTSEAEELSTLASGPRTSQEFKWIDPAKLSWSLSSEERWEICQSFVDLDTYLLRWVELILRQAAIQALRQYHYAKVKASSSSFEGKEVIGGTIVGCITRLEAIRATNPFAILIEEASEVMEPLLFACLGSSTCKLEMIGDHLQLQPSTMNKYDFELNNNINISMFERLVCGSSTHSVPFNVLSVQRRMRKNICDLTRDFYVNITKIIDHPVCATKLIGNGLSECDTNGREVPGISPNIFFWTHNGRQEKAKVGLSRINNTEANMVVQLVAYLVNCGTPKTSIAVLTPYKGQLMLLRNLLQKRGLLNPRPPKAQTGYGYRSPPTQPSVTVSTVDRFQGDEADVVIASLVIDANSRTPFVKLVNRMIVLLSRARLGMYILANADYFRESKGGSEIQHWKDTIEKLSKPAAGDSELPNISVFSGIRMGPKLELCCPVHRQVSKKTFSPRENLELGFCAVKCTEILGCGHPCNENCHFPRKTHLEKCLNLVDSPCPQHVGKLKCFELTANAKKNSRLPVWFTDLTVEEALPKYQCDIKVDVAQECLHVIRMECAKEKDLASGIIGWPTCTQPAHSAFIYPKCKHELNCRCYEKKEYLAAPESVPPCQQSTRWTPQCGHEIYVKCYMQQKYAENNGKGYLCRQKVELSLPRCGHLAKPSCLQAEIINDWEGKACKTGIVFQDEEYGPKDFSCTEQVVFVRTCGHETTFSCEQAFDYANGGSVPSCTVSEKMISPICGHSNLVACAERVKLEKAIPKRIVPAVYEVKDSELDLKYFDVPFSTSFSCKEKVKLRRNVCGHEETLECGKVLATSRQHCKKFVQLKNPLCGHLIKIACGLSNRWQPWSDSFKETAEYADIMESNVLLEDTLQTNINLDPPAAWKLKSCTKLLSVKKANCGHLVDVPCNEAFQCIFGHDGDIVCKENIDGRLKRCGHVREWECDAYQRYLADPHSKADPCKTKVSIQCRSFHLCGSSIEMECGNSEKTAPVCDSLLSWTCPSGTHNFELKLCKRGMPLQCPECFKSSLENSIKMTEIIISKCKDTVAISDMEEVLKARDLIFQYLPESESCSTELQPMLLKSNYKRFVRAKVGILTTFNLWLEKEYIWQAPTFHPKVVPVYIVQKNDAIDSMDIKSCKLNRLRGVEVQEWCLESIQKLKIKSGKKVKLLFGIGFTVHTLVEPKKLPSGKKKGVQSWLVNAKIKNGFDSVQRGTALTFWDPVGLFATHSLEFSVEQLQTMIACWPSDDRVRCSPKYIEFQEGEVSSCQTNIENGMFLDMYMTASEHLSNSALDLDNVYLRHDWDGMDLNTRSLGQSIEAELKGKLSFTNNANQKERNPFAGVKRLQALMNSSSKPSVDLKLFLCLEFLSLGKQNIDEAIEQLNSYLEALNDHNDDAHPLLLVAAARALVFMGERNDASLCFNDFKMLFPDTFENWLSISERECETTAELETSTVDCISSDWPADLWRELKEAHPGVSSKAMDSLIKLTGMRKVKLSVLKYFKTAISFKKMSPEARKKNTPTLNFSFVGNPGTGKTTVARLFGEVLYDSGIRTTKMFVETTAQSLKDKGAAELRNLAHQAEGGVLFIDEAYDLDPKADAKGKPIVSELLTLSENKRENLTIILAGYQEDMQNKLFSYNDGLASRFEEIMFSDFDQAEMLEIWNKMCVEREISFEDNKIGELISKKLSFRANKKGFGNARDVRKIIEKAVQAACSRDDFTGNIVFQIADVMGEHPMSNSKLTAALKELNNTIGWGTVKKSVAEIVELAIKNYERELKGQMPLDILVNKMFLGNPGTGKTSCAKLYGKILKHLNVLSNGDVVCKSASDLIGYYIGETARKTNTVLELAKGKVLVIDEAYNLNDKWWGKQALDVLVERIQGPQDDRVVLLLGYEKPMLEMLRNQNPGLSRRFPKEAAFYFEDYTDDELLKMFSIQCEDQKISPENYKVAEKILRLVNRQRATPNFGNAGALKTILQQAMAKATCRNVLPNGYIQLLDEDVDSGIDSSIDPFDSLKKMYNIDNVRKALMELHDSLKVARDEGDATPDIGHFIFRGSPGTGKTTVARAIASILFQLELLATKQIVETSALKLTGEYLGQTKKRVEEQLDEASGGILFIDEAYELGKGYFSEEAMTSLLEAMTSERYKGTVIIMAGYPKEMDAMLDRNAGLKSRFTQYLDFKDWSPEDSVKHLVKLASDEHFKLDSEIPLQVKNELEALKNLPGWANGRDVTRIYNDAKKFRATRVCETKAAAERVICLEDIMKAVNAMRNGREITAANVVESRPSQSPPPPCGDTSEPPPVTESTNANEAPSEVLSDVEEEKESVDDMGNEPREFGVSNADWEELQESKKAYKEKMEKLKAEKSKAGLENEIQKQEAIQKRLRQIGKCPAGFVWYKVGGGWRCSAGGHFVSDSELQK